MADVILTKKQLETIAAGFKVYWNSDGGNYECSCNQLDLCPNCRLIVDTNDVLKYAVKGRSNGD